jgi:hypothetical protein
VQWRLDTAARDATTSWDLALNISVPPLEKVVLYQEHVYPPKKNIR